jgi:hypothetical protein
MRKTLVVPSGLATVARFSSDKGAGLARKPGKDDLYITFSAKHETIVNANGTIQFNWTPEGRDPAVGDQVYILEVDEDDRGRQFACRWVFVGQYHEALMAAELERPNKLGSNKPLMNLDQIRGLLAHCTRNTIHYPDRDYHQVDWDYRGRFVASGHFYGDGYSDLTVEGTATHARTSLKNDKRLVDMDVEGVRGTSEHFYEDFSDDSTDEDDYYDPADAALDLDAEDDVRDR